MGKYFRIILLVLLSLSITSESFSQPASEFHERRAKLISLLDSNSAAIFKAADGRTRSNDVNYRYRQESNILYLTGINEPGNFLLIIPKGIEIDGSCLNIIFFASENLKDSIRATEHELILNTNRFQEIFNSILPALNTLYVSAPDIGFVNDWLNNRRYYLDKDSKKELESKYPGLKVMKIGSLVAKLRELKSEYEIEQIKRSIEITRDGIRRALEVCKPGVAEYELQATIEYEMIRQGASYTAFPSIIGSGKNTLEYHYDKNRRKTKAGDLVVVDVGAEYNGYAADITRTIPVSGKFTKQQSEVYNIVLQAQKEVIKIIRPGIRLRDLDNKAKELIAEAGYGKYFKHSVSHHLGIDVHDIWSSDTLKAGMVITVEPGIYIPENDDSISTEYRGWGIRIEDDVLVTSGGYEILSRNIPKEVIEIEEMMRKNK